MPEQSERTKIITAGELYKATARQLLSQYHRNLTREQLDQKLQESDFIKLESCVGAAEHLTVMAETLSRILGDIDVVLPENFTEIVLFGVCPSIALAESARLCDTRRLNNGERGLLAFRVIEKLHTTWAWDFRDHFFMGQFAAALYQFAPIELIGYERYEYYYRTYVKPTLTLLHLDADFEFIKRAYETRQDKYLETYHIRDEATLLDTVKVMEYKRMSPGIKHALQTDPAVAKEMARQILAKNPVLFG